MSEKICPRCRMPIEAGDGLILTDHRRVEGVLRDSEASYRTLAENSPDLIIRFDRDLRVIYANPTVLRRRESQDLTGHAAQEYGAAWASARAWEKEARRVLETGETQRFDRTSVWQGKERTYDAVAVPEHGVDGAVKSVMVIARDITEKKQAEAVLATLASETARSNLDLEAFAYAASHDLQEPLRKIAGFLGLLEQRYKQQLDSQAREYIDVAMDGATRMSQLIEDLLEHSRINRTGLQMVLTDTGTALAWALSG